MTCLHRGGLSVARGWRGFDKDDVDATRMTWKPGAFGIPYPPNSVPKDAEAHCRSTVMIEEKRAGQGWQEAHWHAMTRSPGQR